MYPIITISREVGSGGYAVGKKVAEALDIPFIDKEFIEKVAADTGLTQETVADKGEFASKIDKYLNYNFNLGLYLGDEQDAIYKAQANIILEHAWKGPCVIVGRCADAILKSAHIPAIHVFIHADYETRKKNILARGLKPADPMEKFLEKKDKGRQYYYKYYTNCEWGEYKNYQLNLDCGFLGEDACTKMIVETVKAHEVPDYNK